MRPELRLLTDEDLGPRSAWLRHEKSYNNMPLQGEFSAAETAAWFERIRQDACRMDLILEHDGRPVAAGGLTGIGAGTSPELYAFVAPEARGQGYGRTLIEGLCRVVFEVLQRHRLHLWVYGHNVAARRLYESCGFVVEGHLREQVYLGDQWVDRIAMGILLSEWTQAGPPRCDLSRDISRDMALVGGADVGAKAR